MFYYFCYRYCYYYSHYSQHLFNRCRNSVTYFVWRKTRSGCGSQWGGAPTRREQRRDSPTPPSPTSLPPTEKNVTPSGFTPNMAGSEESSAGLHKAPRNMWLLSPIEQILQLNTQLAAAAAAVGGGREGVGGEKNDTATFPTNIILSFFYFLAQTNSFFLFIFHLLLPPSLPPSLPTLKRHPRHILRLCQVASWHRAA